jgi:hypothetical protein
LSSDGFVLAIKSTSGDIYKWNERHDWYTTDKGKDYSNPGFLGLTFDITNSVQSNVQHSVGQMAKDAITQGDPFASVEKAYGKFEEGGGRLGPLGFVFQDLVRRHQTISSEAPLRVLKDLLHTND